MAKMIPLHPAPCTALPVEGWELLALEAGRYAAGLVATLHARNGELQTAQQLPLAHPQRWAPFMEEVAKLSGCAAEDIARAIRELIEAIEILLRPKSKPTPQQAPLSGGARPRIQVNSRYLRDIVADATTALAAANHPPALFVRGGVLVHVPLDANKAKELPVPALRLRLDHAADFVRVVEYGDEPAWPPKDVCESILAEPPRQKIPTLTSICTITLVRGDAEEHEKRITALLVAGASWILLDNVTALVSAPLAAVLTTTQWRGRLLGLSKIVEPPNDATWVATGNNVELSDEIARRTVPIRLDPSVERPEERTDFEHPELLTWVREHRATLVSACLSLVRAWMDAGRPTGTAILGSYESWARVLGGILGVSGVSGFLGGRERLYSDADRQTAEWCALCEAWWEAHADHPVTAKEVFEVAKTHGLLLQVWAGRKDLAAQQRVGHALASIRDRVFSGYRGRPAGRDSVTKNAAYRLEPIKPAGAPESSIGIEVKEKTPETPKTPPSVSQLPSTQEKSPSDNHGCFHGHKSKTPKTAGCLAGDVAKTPPTTSKTPPIKSLTSGVLGVSGVSEASPDSIADEEVI